MKQIAAIFVSFEAFRGAWDGDLKLVKEFLKHHPELKDEPGIHDTTLLYCATRNKHVDIVRFLVEEAKCSVNAENRPYLPSAAKSNRPSLGSTALHAACFLGHIDLVKYLTEHGGDYFQLNSVGESPLLNGCKNKAIAQFYAEFLLLGYRRPDEKLATRSAWEEVSKSGPIDDAIWEYQSPNDFQWLQFSSVESDELQRLLRQQTEDDKPFQSIVQLRGAENLFSISLQQFARLGKDRFGKGKLSWIRCRASPLKNFALFTHWQLMFSRYPQSTDDRSAYADVNALPKKISTLKLHSWYQLDPPLTLRIERAMNYRRRYISLHLPSVSPQKIFFNFETFLFFSEDHSIEGCLRWIPKLISDDPRRFQLVDNFQADEKSTQYRALTQRRFLHLRNEKILSPDEEKQHHLQSIEFDDQTDTNDLKLFLAPNEKGKANTWETISIEAQNPFDVPCDVVVIPVFSETLRAAAIRAGANPVEKIITSMEKGENKNYLNSVPLTKAAAKVVYLVNWKDERDPTKGIQSLEELISRTMTAARDDRHQSIAYPLLKCDQSKIPMVDVAYTMLRQIDRELSGDPMQVSLCPRHGSKEHFRACIDAFTKLKKDQEERESQPIIVKFGSGASMHVAKGDLTKQQADVIAASSSSENLTQILLLAAGKDVLEDFNQQQKANPNALIIITPSGDLKCKKIFFLKWEPVKDDELLKQSVEDLIHNLVQNLLSYNFTSIAFPAIGCGEYGFNINILIKTIVRSFRHQLMKRKLSWVIHFVIQPHQQQIFDEFSRQTIASNQGEVKLGNYAVPSDWMRTAPGERRAPVDLRSPEALSIISNFDETMKGKYKTIVRIDRIQNERWYMQYLAHAKDFQDRLKDNTEKLLFHGCPEDAAYQICEDCFNRSFAGKNGTVYGVGVYFTTNAAYSNSYSKPNSKGERCMFLAQVLVGKTTIGNSTMKVRPVGFDSTTDGKHIIVTYHDAQAYAKYLIFYQ